MALLRSVIGAGRRGIAGPRSLPVGARHVTCSARHLGWWHRMFGGEGALKQRKQKNLEKRQAIIDQLQSLSPLQEFKRNRGKRHEAPTTLVPEEEAPPFPHVDCTTIAGNRVTLPPRAHGISVILISFREISKPMVEQYASVFEEATTGQKQAPLSLYKVLPLDGRLQAMFANAVSAALAKQYPQEDHDRVCLVKDGVEELKDALNLFSPYTCFCFVLDARGRIRWRAHGHPSDTEQQTIASTVVPQLMREGRTSDSNTSGYGGGEDAGTRVKRRAQRT